MCKSTSFTPPGRGGQPILWKCYQQRRHGLTCASQSYSGLLCFSSYNNFSPQQLLLSLAENGNSGEGFIHFGELLSFPEYLPCIQETHRLSNFCMFLLLHCIFITGCLSQKPRRAERIIFPPPKYVDVDIDVVVDIGIWNHLWPILPLILLNHFKCMSLVKDSHQCTEKCSLMLFYRILGISLLKHFGIALTLCTISFSRVNIIYFGILHSVTQSVLKTFVKGMCKLKQLQFVLSQQSTM